MRVLNSVDATAAVVERPVSEERLNMSANAGVVEYLKAGQCPRQCPFTNLTTAHHDQLLAIDQDMDQAMSLIELAVTWGELDYSQATLIGPSQWPDFVASHSWQDRDRAERLFSLAGDAAAHSVAAGMLRVV